MANYTSTKTGNWSDSTVWGGVPTSADNCTIASGHTITLDTTGCVCLSLSIAATGRLVCSTTANSDLTVQQGIASTAGNTAIPYQLDLSSTPSCSCTIKINASSSATAAHGLMSLSAQSGCVLKGYPRKRKTTLTSAITAGATSATVADATGWQVGDKIIFATTSAYAITPAHDEVTLTSVSGGNIGWFGGITYAHDAGGYVGNFTSNLIITAGAVGANACFYWDRSYPSDSVIQQKTIDNVLFDQIAYTGHPYYSGVAMAGGGASASNENKLTISNCAFYNTPRNQNGLNIAVGGRSVVSGCVAINADQTANNYYPKNFSLGVGSSKIVASDLGAFGGRNTYTAGHVGISLNGRGSSLSNSFSCGCAGNGAELLGAIAVGGAGLVISGLGISVDNVDTFANYIGYGAFDVSADAINIRNAYYSETGGAANGAGGNDRYYSYVQANVIGSLLAYAGGLLGSCISDSRVSLIDHNRDVTSQEIYSPYMAIKRDNSIAHRSTSSIAIYPTVVSTDCQRALSISCPDGASVRVIGYVKKSHATNISATVAITGLGSSVAPFTKADDTNWEQFDLSATNSSGADGNFTLTYTANSSSGTTNVVYFDGVPDAPFITKARHYGFLFNETSSTVTTDSYTVASEATAAAYTGVTINNSTQEISFGAGTADTAQKFYDYSRAWCVADLTRQIPFSRAGSLFSLTSGWTVVDPAYTTTLTWGGGTVQFTSTGAKAVNIDAAIVEFNVATGGTFTMTGTLTGTLDLRNLDDTAITVEVPTSTGYTTANNTGGAITVTTPQIYQSVTVSGATAGSRIQIYDTAASAELYNGTPIFPYTWTDGVAAAANRTIRLRIMSTDTTPGNAEIMIDKVIGTCGTTAGTAALSYLHAPEPDDVYNGNGFDGSTVTGMTIDDAALRLSVTAGTIVDYSGTDVLVIDGRKIYAYETYWLGTEAGIRDESRFIRAMDAVNFRFVDFKIINETATPVYPVLINNAYLVDDATGVSATLVDYAGGPVHFAPDHMISNVVTVGGANIITGDIATVLAAIPTASDNADEVLAAINTTTIPVDVKKMNGATVIGSGTSSDLWRG